MAAHDESADQNRQVTLFRLIAPMGKTSRRRFLTSSGSMLVYPLFPRFLRSASADIHFPQLTEPEWREPGQTKDPEYLRTAKLRYSAEGYEIVGNNRTCFNNRPLYCDPTANGVVLAGDRPFVRLLSPPNVLGGFAAAIVRNGRGKWFHYYDQVESRYRCGRMTWQISDPSLEGLQVMLQVVPIAGVSGFALRMQAEGLSAGDRLIWSFGGARHEGDVRRIWDPVMHGNPKVLKLGNPRKPEMNLAIDPERCAGNLVTLEGANFRVLPAAGSAQAAFGISLPASVLRVVDASAAEDPARYSKSTAGNMPMVCGVLELPPGEQTVHWAVQSAAANADPTSLPMASPATAFAEGAAYLKSVERVQVETPDPYLNATLIDVCHAIDGSCDRNPYIFRHGCMAFSIHFLGWRVICGATALGWHDRVKGDAAHYTALQIRDGQGRDHAEPDPKRRLSLQGPESRFYGRGHIPRDTFVYNTQSQFFDQVVRDWRWTADAEMEKLLRPALELHLEWVHDCFDPDDDGLYESYIDTLPTDSVWYNGGGSVEESAYAYYGHRAASDMARRAGDLKAAERHTQRAEKIRAALARVLWLEDRGHFALYVEQGGHQRVHSDAWVYSEFLPIDAGVATLEQAAQALYYTEWALERIRLPFGGEVCQPSNWVPWKWSVRDMFGGDLCAQALAYFQTGLPAPGWELLRGAVLESAYASSVPGGLSHVGAGTDFADNTNMFARTVVEGLFGYAPDYPNGVVHMRPSFPFEWPEAKIATSDFWLEFKRDGAVHHYHLTLSQPAEIEFRLPVCAEKIRTLAVNGKECAWQAKAGFGCTWVRFRTANLSAAEVRLEVADPVPFSPPVHLTGQSGDKVTLEVPRGRISSQVDFHEVLQSPEASEGKVNAVLANKPGYHMVWLMTEVGKLPQCQVFKIHITEPALAIAERALVLRQAPQGAQWNCLDLAPHFNADVRTIFQQQYLSPRPATCSVRLGVDGYSAWTFTFWHESPPAIDLEQLDRLTDAAGRIVTPQATPFHQLAADRNIAFTSLWDNWPRTVTVPIKQAAEAVWLLVCGTTFPNQTRIANAEFRFRYADGVEEKLELVPPFNFWTLSTWGGEYYNYALDAFSLPPEPPPMVELGDNCRAMVLSQKLRPGVRLEEVTLETLSQDVVIGLMGLSLTNPR